ncbi:MAG: N-acetylglutaminylglutamine synthetase [Actinomycetota bacterium]|nr:N-acetylglutaminylglutamine synthetase [Actinomycetota bacterium]
MTGRCREAATVDCGWGRLVFGQTYSDSAAVANALRAEAPGSRDICLYASDPHVVVGHAPNELFIDPSHTYRLELEGYRPRRRPLKGIAVRALEGPEDARAVNHLYLLNSMVTAPDDRIVENQQGSSFTYLIAEDTASGRVIGSVMGVDHVEAFDDPEGGTSLWCLAVDPQSSRPGAGEALVRSLAEHFLARGRRSMDLSVLHDNLPAIRLYEKLGFRRVPVYCIKRKNPINEPLFVPGAVPGLEDLNPYARIVADEALRRGVEVEVLDAQWGELRLTFGGRSIVTRESLSELTSAIAMSRCDDKRVTRRILGDAGLRVPRGVVATGDDADLEALERFGPVVVKPARGEQGAGITVGVDDPEELRAAVARAAQVCEHVLIEERCDGVDLRIVVIDHRVVAAAVRRPAAVVGDGRHTIEELIAAQSRRRAAATGGESTIPVDDVTVAVLRDQGLTLDSVPGEGERIEVRGTANLHTGGTIHDVTEELHPALADAAVVASRAIDIPVTGIDLLVPDVSGPDYVMIEANERPGLANHEPQPTAEAFVDLLFPTLRRRR